MIAPENPLDVITIVYCRIRPPMSFEVIDGLDVIGHYEDSARKH